MRKGFSLVEMLAVIFVLTVILLIMGPFFRLFACELPKDFRLVQESCVLKNAVSHIRADVACAKILTESVGDSAEPSTLAMRLPEGTVSYEFNEGRILRRLADTSDTGSEDIVWSVPHGRIEWKVWNKDQTGYAVELRTYIEDKDLGLIRRKLANNYLFFADTLSEAVK
jgi:prepilin-type N-terminal cleavage/methylation domain-containing protein